MNENLIAVQEAVSLTHDQLVQLARNAFEIAWLADDEKARYLGALEAYAAATG
jgi:adenosine deaminase